MPKPVSPVESVIILIPDNGRDDYTNASPDGTHDGGMLIDLNTLCQTGIIRIVRTVKLEDGRTVSDFTGVFATLGECPDDQPFYFKGRLYQPNLPLGT